jgi:hypothetical protein
LYHLNNSYICIHIESTTLADGTYKLVLEPESEQLEARINLTEVIKNPNQNSVEPKASFAQEDKPRSITPIFFTYATFTYIWYCALSL